MPSIVPSVKYHVLQEIAKNPFKADFADPCPRLEKSITVGHLICKSRTAIRPNTGDLPLRERDEQGDRRETKAGAGTSINSHVT